MQTNFYSRPCGRGDLKLARFVRSCVSISTHAPAGGATKSSAASAMSAIFLLTPLREGRQTVRDILLVSADISTHAPAGGATRSSRCRKRLNPFLLTPLREGRLGCVLVFAVQEHISTHAPAGGATKVAVPVVLAFGYFYSRPCGRGDAVVIIAVYLADQFLLTPLREGRPAPVPLVL